ncbi:TraX family protein [Stenotrophomonas sp. CFBP 13725]|uniref:TraX family protein n=1 Tax=Stenotrophomonas sp. CFBP 13725 TaxID=2775297 RepID=UPI00177BA096|nr:TraX family protein [Stenotrophomonas sp. CFBP 13725]MBD8634467.1 conjugal transfer protein [Stenotrophomonas sp. CFBP 13725]
MTSGGRELLKWIAVLLMTGDHVTKVLELGYVPVATELGRVAFPLFALVLSYNLALPGTDLVKSIRRLFAWGLVATPVAFMAFGELLPLNVLVTFSVGSTAIWSIERRNWPVAAFAMLIAPLVVDYGFPGVWLVVAAHSWFRQHGKRMHWLLGCWDFRRSRLYLVLPVWIWICMALLCLYNGNAWALLALPLMQLGELSWTIPRTRWAFYAYYVGHLVVLTACS